MKVIPRNMPLVTQVDDWSEVSETSAPQRGEVRYYPREDRAMTDLVEDDEWIDADGEYLDDIDAESAADPIQATQILSHSPAHLNTPAYTEFPTADKALAKVIGGGQMSSGRTPTSTSTPQTVVDERLLQILRSTKLYA